MPREGYSQVTVPNDLKALLTREAQTREVSVPVLLRQLLDRPPTSDFINPRVLRIIKTASRIFQKPPDQALEKLIDTPARVLLDKPEVKTHDLIKEGVELIKDLDPARAKEIEGALKDLQKK